MPAPAVRRLSARLAAGLDIAPASSECIDCAVCVPECPVDAIYAEHDLPPHLKDFLALNATLSRRWKGVTASGPPLPDAEAWKGRSDKRALLDC